MPPPLPFPLLDSIVLNQNIPKKLKKRGSKSAEPISPGEDGQFPAASKGRKPKSSEAMGPLQKRQLTGSNSPSVVIPDLAASPSNLSQANASFFPDESATQTESGSPSEKPPVPAFLPRPPQIQALASIQAALELPKTPEINQTNNEKEHKDVDLQASLQLADAIEITDYVARLSVKYHDTIGTIALSKDHAALGFFGIESADLALLSVPISSFRTYPVVSMKGSYPMELIVYVKDDEGTAIDYRFNIGLAAEAHNQANIMRAKLSGAMGIHAKSTKKGEISEALITEEAKRVFPFLCDKCNKRWKNREGIIYHKNKSQGPCNKNWNAEQEERRLQRQKEKADKAEATKRRKEAAKREEEAANLEATLEAEEREAAEEAAKPKPKFKITISLKKAVPQDEDATMDPHERAENSPDAKEHHTEASEANYESDASSQSSADSIFEWAQRVAMPGPKSTLKRRRSSVTVNRNPLQAIVDRNSEQHESEGTAYLMDRNSDIRQITKNIILDLVKTNYGVFPGDRSLWYAVFAMFLKTFAHQNVVITPEMCSNALSMLLVAGRLKSSLVRFQVDDLELAERHIITDPSVDPKPEIVAKLEELIRGMYPEYYVPSRFAPEAKYFAVLRGVNADGSYGFEEPQPKRQKQDRSLLQSTRASTFLSDREEFYDDEGMAEEVSEGDYDSGSVMEDVYKEHIPVDENAYQRRKRLQRERAANGQPKRQRRPNGDASVKYGVATTGMPQKEYRAMRRALREQAWAPAPAFLQSITGAWGVVPPRVQKGKLQFSQSKDGSDAGDSKLGSKPDNRMPGPYSRRLPEPITYMQVSNGAWSFRPYGHGVKPIYARPSRMAIGNPLQRNYLQHRDSSFRPVMQPVGVRVYGPQPLSKYLVEPAKTTSRPGKRKAPEDSVRDETPEAADAADSETPVPMESARPKRAYNGRASNNRRESSVSIGPSISPVDSVAKPTRVVRTPRQAKMDPIQTLNFFMPQIVAGVESSNPGLNTLPSYFGLRYSGGPLVAGEKYTDFNVDDILHDRMINISKAQLVHENHVLTDIEETAKWEQNVANEFFNGGKVGSISGWINHSPMSFEPGFDTEVMTLKWRDDAAFTIETLPYKQLNDMDFPDYGYVDIPTKPTAEKPAGPVIPRYRIEMDEFIPGFEQTKSTRLKKQQDPKQKTRYVTVLASKFDEIADAADPVAAGKELGIQVVAHHAVAKTKRKDPNISSEDEMRLIVAVVGIRNITGGVEKMIDWTLVGTAFKDDGFSTNFLYKRWLTLSRTKKEMIDKLSPKFQQAYLSAYAKGEVPSIDYEDLPAYNWRGLVDWGMKALVLDLGAAHFNLPETRKALGKQYDCVEKEVDPKGRERYYNPAGGQATWKRLQYVANIPAVAPLRLQSRNMLADDIEIDEVMVAKSLVRAAALTPAEEYDREVAAEKFNSIDNSVLEEAIESLRKDNVIRKRKNHVPGRQYEASFQFTQLIQRRQVPVQSIIQAKNFKRFLDDEFSSGKERVRVGETNEGITMVITQLQAHNRIRLQGVNIPSSKFGFVPDGGYDTNRIPRGTFNFAIDIYPTSEYANNASIPAVKDILGVELPRGGPAGESPVWYGITGKVIQELWRKILVSFSGILALRTGSTVKTLEMSYKNALEEWEIRRLLEWGERFGIFKRLHGEVDGWTVTEWWWAIIGEFCGDAEGMELVGGDEGDADTEMQM